MPRRCPNVNGVNERASGHARRRRYSDVILTLIEAKGCR
jgi:hypothetical protein